MVGLCLAQLLLVLRLGTPQIAKMSLRDGQERCNVLDTIIDLMLRQLPDIVEQGTPKHHGLLELSVERSQHRWGQQETWQQAGEDLLPEANNNSKLVDGIFAVAGDSATRGLLPVQLRLDHGERCRLPCSRLDCKFTPHIVGSVHQG